MENGSIRMQALQRADKLLGRVACVALQPLRWLRPLSRRRTGVGRVLLIKFWGIGSLQLLTPAVASLRRRHPDAQLSLLTLAANRETAEALGVFDRVLCLDVERASWLGVFARILRLVASLRNERFDVVYDFEFFTRFSAVVSLLTGAPESHGFTAPSLWRGGFHTDVAPFNRYWHVARNFRVLAGGENGRNVAHDDLAPYRCELADHERAELELRQHHIDPSRPFAVLNPNAGALSLERRWPQPMFAELGRRLVREDGLAVVLVGSPSERAYTQRVADCVPADSGAPIVNLAGRLTTGELAALLSRCAVFVSNDSGPMHLAAALGTPTVGLFGPETPVMYAPIGLRTKALYRPPACSPCINVHNNKVASCIYGFPQCLVQIEVSEVLAAARAFLRGEELDEFVLSPRAHAHSDAETAQESA